MVHLNKLSTAATLFIGITFGIMISACESDYNESTQFTGAENEVTLMTLNPGHFHAALVQKNMLRQVNPDVYIFAPEGADLELHKTRIESFNTRRDSPASWNLITYTGDDYFDTMLEERPGNVMVAAGNNRMKTDYILQTINEGIHVLSDKPMAIDTGGWQKLSEAFRLAEKHQNTTPVFEVVRPRQFCRGDEHSLSRWRDVQHPQQRALQKDHGFVRVCAVPLK